MSNRLPPVAIGVIRSDTEQFALRVKISGLQSVSEQYDLELWWVTYLQKFVSTFLVVLNSQPLQNAVRIGSDMNCCTNFLG